MSIDLSFLWLEITGKCQLACAHCYANSSPQGTHGKMGVSDWRRVIDETESLGVAMVQFIGGEPTLNPVLPDLVGHALERGLSVEVFSNLVHVTPRLWGTFARPGVRLATSYYSDDADEHETVTRSRGSHRRTKVNIVETLRRSIPLRVGLIDVQDGQRVEQAHAELTALGVTDIGMDRLRQVGRGVRDQQPDASQLCGACARGKVAIASNGDVWPCVFARWMPIGNIQSTKLAEIITSPQMEAAQHSLGHDGAMSGCPPQNCSPGCHPSCGPSCLPSNFHMSKCAPQTQCKPASNPNPCNPTCPPGYHSSPKKCWPYYYEHGK